MEMHFNSVNNEQCIMNKLSD